jgi:drug/metabolite transporter (DMT)-like permease
MVYLIVFGSMVAFSAYAWLLKVVSPSRVATYAYVNPVVALLLGWLLAGEPLTTSSIIGSVVVLSAVWLITQANSGNKNGPRQRLNQKQVKNGKTMHSRELRHV